jgi:hypothetical protein
MSVPNNIRIIIDPIFLGLDGKFSADAHRWSSAQLIIDPHEMSAQGIKEAELFQTPKAWQAMLVDNFQRYAPTTEQREALLRWALPHLTTKQILPIVDTIKPDAREGDLQQLVNDQISPHVVPVDFRELPAQSKDIKNTIIASINAQVEQLESRLSGYKPPQYNEPIRHQMSALKGLAAYMVGEHGDVSDRKIVESMLQKLPTILRNALIKTPTNILVSSTLMLYTSHHGMAVPTHDSIVLNPDTLQNRNLAMRVFQEEVLHLLDYRLRFTEKSEWKEAVRKEIASFDGEKIAAIGKALGDNKQNPYTSESLYHSDLHREAEMLVDYFHVKSYFEREAKQQGVILEKEALNQKMQDFFPNIFPLCRRFERQLLELSKENALSPKC